MRRCQTPPRDDEGLQRRRSRIQLVDTRLAIHSTHSGESTVVRNNGSGATEATRGCGIGVPSWKYVVGGGREER